ncbi:short-chain dehydrogenase/reductase SDR [Fimicolochytrium jonesii]|uniref:short-chain dehydrogenase/reductase SDR n=1 Tax=Fimicolochytrium jonesii TaxID=1396493 RepID=UPI0022FE6499|nr:short-chain dehydrogenase/reductase SDR [Fimicolochytrium jonesii]KAI8819481.1 short-chain dehydrogenase/reductase SDR [Fimicolochytrium jonesii]
MSSSKAKDTTAYPQPGQVPPQTQLHHDQPGLQSEMTPKPNDTELEAENKGLEEYRGSGKLEGKVALITGGDSGIGRSAAIMFAKEGANVAIAYTPQEEQDAQEVKQRIEAEGRQCLLLPTDISIEQNCSDIVSRTVSTLGHLDILVNNAAVQYIIPDITQLTTAQLEKTFKTNIFSMFWLVKAAVPHLKTGASIINTTSVTAYKGSPSLLDYSSTKGAIVSFTRSLALQLAPKGIRVNAIAPGPIWTPLQPVSRSEESIKEWQEKTPPLGRIGQPAECGPSYVFLASKEGSYYTGQVLHPNGGQWLGG